jgi:transcriptional regulator with XRE-family HTH domain
MRRRRPERMAEYERPAFTELKARLAANVRRLREERSWTQEEAADRSRMATPLFQRLEAAATNATLITLSKLCEGFGVDVAQLFAARRGSAPMRSEARAPVLHERPANYDKRPRNR